MVLLEGQRHAVSDRPSETIHRCICSLFVPATQILNLSDELSDNRNSAGC